MCRKSMAHDMWCEIVENSGLLSIPGEQLPKSLPRHGTPTIGHEQEWTRPASQQPGPGSSQIVLYRLKRRFANRNYPMLVALADDADETHVSLQVRHTHAAQFRDSQSCG